MNFTVVVPLNALTDPFRLAAERVTPVLVFVEADGAAGTYSDCQSNPG